MRSTLLLVSCVLVAFTVESQAREDSFNNRTVSVRYSDLDLSNPADVQVLHRRVDRAVKSACTDATDVGAHRVNSDRAHCLAMAREQAMASLSSVTTQMASRAPATRPTQIVAITNAATRSSPDQVRAVQVSWNKNDLQRENRLVALRNRIDRAAREVCSSGVDDGAGLATSQDKRRCMDEARSRAYADMGASPQFAALNGRQNRIASTSKNGSLWDWLVTILK